MTKDEIWNQIKNDKSTVYGQSMLAMFLMAIEKDLSPGHLKEALENGYAESINQNAIIRAIREAPFPSVIDMVMSHVKSMSSSLVYIILLKVDDMEQTSPKMGKNLSKMSDDDFFNLLYLRSGKIPQIAKLFPDRIKSLSGERLLVLLREKLKNLNGLNSLVEILGGWDHVIDSLMRSRQRDTSWSSMDQLWGSLANKMKDDGLLGYFIEKLSAVKDKYPQAGIVIEFLSSKLNGLSVSYELESRLAKAFEQPETTRLPDGE